MKTQLQNVCRFAARRSPLDVLNTVRITKTFCYATDSTSSMRIAIDGPDLDVCVDAGTLADILGGFAPDQTISITEGPGHILIKGGNRRLKVRTIPNQGMPEIEAGGEFHLVDPASISAALKFALPAAAVKNVAQPAFTNVLINLTATGTFVVGCDGVRLHAYKLDDAVAATDVTCLLPRALAARLAGMCEIGGTLKVNRHRVVYEKGDSVFISVLGGMEYPAWKRIIPTPDKYQTRVSVNPSMLASLCDNVVRLGAEFLELDAKNGVDPHLSMKADLKGDEFSDRMECDVAGEDSINVRPVYLADVMAALGSAAPVTIHIPPSTVRKGLPLLFTNGGPHTCFAMGYRV